MQLSRSNLKPTPYPILFTITLFIIACTSVQFLTLRDATASESQSQPKPQLLPAPQFSLPGISGDKTLEDYRGQYLYVDFWASWCGPCRQSFPWMNEMQDKYDTHGLKIIAINLDEIRDDANRFLDDVHADVDIAFDASGATAQAYSVKGMPSSYLINPAGEIVFSHIGFRARDEAQLEAKIAELMGDAN